MHDTTINTAAARGRLARLGHLVHSHGPRAFVRHVATAGVQRLHTIAEITAQRWRGPDPTGGKHELDELTIAGPNGGAGVHFLSTPWAVLDWVHSAVPPAAQSATFVDLGAGKGRAVLSAARRAYPRVIGVEFASELAAIAADNVVAAGHGTDRVTIVAGDAADFALPEGPLVVFLFNPFGPPVIDRVAARIANAARARVEPIHVAYLNPVHARVFAADPAFVPVRQPWRTRLALATLSPYRLHIYAVRRT